MKKVLYFLFLGVNVYASPTICTPLIYAPGTTKALIASGEAALGTMQGLIVKLGTNSVPGLCVPVPPLDPNQLALCSAMIGTYTAAVTTISQPCTIDLSLEPSYLTNPFDPCKYTVSGLLGAGVYCPLTTYKPY